MSAATDKITSAKDVPAALIGTGDGFGEAIAALEALADAIDAKESALICDSAGTPLSRMRAVNGVIFAKQRAREIVSAFRSPNVASETRGPDAPSA